MNLAHPVALAALALALAAPATAQQRVYQWKDAQGVTHYADTAPKQTHQARDIDARTGTTTETTATKPQESEQCRNARSNLQRLQGNDAIGIDSNGDGKPDRNLTDAERKSQTELNQAGVKAFCPPATP